MAKTKTIEHQQSKPSPQKGVATKQTQAVTVVKPRKVASAKSVNILAQLLDVASRPGVNVESVRVLREMYEAQEDKKAHHAYVRDFIAMQAELPEIRSDGKIEIKEKDASGRRTEKNQQETPYSTYPNLKRVCRPIMQKYGFAYQSYNRPAPDGRIVCVGELMYTHKETERSFIKSSEFPLPAETSGSKNNVQGWGSSASFGKRYNFIGLMDITSYAAVDDDKNGFDQTDREQPEPQKISPKQLEEIQAAIEFAGIDPVRIFEKYKVEKLVDIPANRHKDVLASIKSYKERKDRLSAEGQDKAN